MPLMVMAVAETAAAAVLLVMYKECTHVTAYRRKQASNIVLTEFNVYTIVDSIALVVLILAKFGREYDARLPRVLKPHFYRHFY